MEKNYIIYKIVCKDLNVKNVYVGSTINFRMRKWFHKSSCNNENYKNYNLKLYQFIRENGGFNQFDMVQIETLLCSKREAEAKERFYYEQLNADLNDKKPYISEIEKKEYKKEYYEEHKEELNEKKKIYRANNDEMIKQKQKEYYKNNKETILEKHKETFICECGSVLTFNSKTRHLKTKIHLDYINNLETN